MSLSLKNIIESYFHKVRSSDLASIISKRSQLAALILAEMYELYENSKNKELLVEINFFLNIKNPIKHLVNILNNSSGYSGYSIDEAIINEFKSLNEKKSSKHINLFSILEDLVNNGPINELLIDQLIGEIITKLMNERIMGHLDEDTKNFLLQKDTVELLTTLLNNIISGKSLIDSISELYMILDLRKVKNHEIDDMKDKIVAYLESNFEELHGHVNYVGENTFEAINALTDKKHRKNYRKHRGNDSDESLFN